MLLRFLFFIRLTLIVWRLLIIALRYRRLTKNLWWLLLNLLFQRKWKPRLSQDLLSFFRKARCSFMFKQTEMTMAFQSVFASPSNFSLNLKNLLDTLRVIHRNVSWLFELQLLSLIWLNVGQTNLRWVYNLRRNYLWLWLWLRYKNRLLWCKCKDIYSFSDCFCH